MEQGKLRSDLNSIERKINLLVNNYREARSEVEVLKQENDDLKELLKRKEGQISDFQNKIKISKLVGNVEVEEEDTSELKKKIDEYITEIDSCITFLTQE